MRCARIIGEIMADLRGSDRENTVDDGTNLVAGTMIVDADNNTIVVVPTNETAGTLRSNLSITRLINIDYPARVGAFPDSGLPIFEVL